jgi:hypothetical protein
MPSFSDFAEFEGFCFLWRPGELHRCPTASEHSPAATPSNFALVSQPKPVR